MSFGPFGRGRTDDDLSVPPPPAASAGALTAFIDQGSEFEGKLCFKDTVRIDGRFRGEIQSENTLIIGESGAVEANIRSAAVVVAGRVDGDLVAERQVVLHKTAVVNGDIETSSLVIEDGATLDGRITMQARPRGGKAETPANARADASSGGKGPNSGKSPQAGSQGQGSSKLKGSGGS